MKTIWKYPLKIDDLVQIEMPKGAKVLCLQVQKDVACIWAEVNSLAEKEARFFTVCGTGHRIPEIGILQYVGSFQILGGDLVFHVYEKIFT